MKQTTCGGGSPAGPAPCVRTIPSTSSGIGDTIAVAGIEFEVTPGHSRDHVAFCAGGRLFSGDLLFAGSVGRFDLPGGE